MMPVIQRTIVTGAAIEEAFASLADFSNAADWDPGPESAKAQDDGSPRPGQVYDLVVTWGNRSLDMQYEIVELEEPRLIRLLGEGTTTSADDLMELAPLPDGGTVVTYTADIRLRGPLRLIEPLLRSKFKALGDEAERGMRTRLERIAADPPTR
mgnify:FL=1